MKKIAIIGPESTGKTELSRSLAAYYRAPWIPEFAREYVEQLNEQYKYEDVCNIARHQVEQEIALRDNAYLPMVFFDTDLIITKVWFEYSFQKVPDFVLHQLDTHFFDMYLLCQPDLPWIEDPVREHGDDRDFFYDWYKKEITLLGTPFFEVGGQGEERTKMAIRAVNHMK